MKTNEENFSGLKLSGIAMILINILLTGLSIWLFIWQIKSGEPNPLLIMSSIILFIVTLIFWAGFMQIEPNEARVMVFFGKYKGTVKENGFFWVNPFYAKKQLTLRARNLDAAPIKVNDKTGNPIMIGMVVVWKVVDTYKASFDVDNNSMSSGTPGTPKDNLTLKM